MLFEKKIQQGQRTGNIPGVCSCKHAHMWGVEYYPFWIGLVKVRGCHLSKWREEWVMWISEIREFQTENSYCECSGMVTANYVLGINKYCDLNRMREILIRRWNQQSNRRSYFVGLYKWSWNLLYFWNVFGTKGWLCLEYLEIWGGGLGARVVIKIIQIGDYGVLTGWH